jgi:DNA-binding transcriptional MerR regulator
MTKNNEQTFSISQASQETGVTKNRIREWHQKGFLKEVQLISVGKRFHRRFPSSVTSLIRNINEYQERGFTLKAAAEKANSDAGNKTKKGEKEGKENG